MKMYLNEDIPFVEGTPEEMLEFINLVIQKPCERFPKRRVERRKA